MTNGAVKFFNETRGFGFVQPDNVGKDVFGHVSALDKAGLMSLVEGQKLAFDTEADRRTGKIAVGTMQAA